MSKRVKPNEVKRKMSRDLITLSQLLKRNSGSIVLNPEVLTSSANQCLNGGGDEWSYQIAGLQLIVDLPQNVRPKGIGKNLNVTIDLDISGYCDEEREHTFKNLILELKIENEERTNLCSWHFDRHISDPGDVSTDAHPLYHFQHGGNQMEELEDFLGRVLLLPAPRVASPPMEGVLCIDFVLSNFAGNEWRALREDSTYLKLLQEAQLRLWRPYLERLTAWWTSGDREKESILELWPHFA